MAPDDTTSHEHWADRQVPWRSRQPSTATRTDRLTIDDVVIYGRHPFTVISIEPDGVPPQHWPESFRLRWEAHQPADVTPEQWPLRPWRIDLEIIGTPLPAASSRDNGRFRALGADPSSYWRVLPEHFSVCRICSELPPCRHTQREELLGHQQDQLREVLDLQPGTCLGCRTPITPRQKTITFAGPNLIRPDFGDDSAVFHARQSCREKVEHYDLRLAKATGAEARFNCPGVLVIHSDHVPECSRGPACIDHQVPHAGYEPHYNSPFVHDHDNCWCVTRPGAKEGPHP